MIRNHFLPWIAAASVALTAGTASADEGGLGLPQYCQSQIIANVVPLTPGDGPNWSVADWTRRVRSEMENLLNSLLLAGSFEDLIQDTCATWNTARLAWAAGELELAGVLTRKLGSRHSANPPEQRFIEQTVELDADLDPTAELSIDGLRLFRGCDADGPFAFPWSQTRHGSPHGDSAATGHTKDQTCWRKEGTPLRVRLFLRRSAHVFQLTRGDAPLREVTLRMADLDKPSSALELVSPAPAPTRKCPVPVQPAPVVSSPSPWPFVAIGAFSLALGAGTGAVWADVNVHERIVDYREVEPTPSDLTRAAAAIHAAKTERTAFATIAIGSAVVGAASVGLWLWAPASTAQGKVAPKVGFGLSARDGLFATAYGEL